MLMLSCRSTPGPIASTKRTACASSSAVGTCEAVSGDDGGGCDGGGGRSGTVAARCGGAGGGGESDTVGAWLGFASGAGGEIDTVGANEAVGEPVWGSLADGRFGTEPLRLACTSATASSISCTCSAVI